MYLHQSIDVGARVLANRFEGRQANVHGRGLCSQLRDLSWAPLLCVLRCFGCGLIEERVRILTVAFRISVERLRSCGDGLSSWVMTRPLKSYIYSWPFHPPRPDILTRYSEPVLTIRSQSPSLSFLAPQATTPILRSHGVLRDTGHLARTAVPEPHKLIRRTSSQRPCKLRGISILDDADMTAGMVVLHQTAQQASQTDGRMCQTAQ